MQLGLNFYHSCCESKETRIIHQADTSLIGRKIKQSMKPLWQGVSKNVVLLVYKDCVLSHYLFVGGNGHPAVLSATLWIARGNISNSPLQYVTLFQNSFIFLIHTP